MFSGKRVWAGWACIIAALAMSNVAVRAQETPAVKVQDLKASPQRYWASFFVFNDVLKEKPQGDTLRIDGRTVTRFQTKSLGTIYAEREALDLFDDLNVGEEYLYVGTVSQRARSMFGLFRRSSFVVIVRDITPFQQSAADITDQLTGINREGTTNEFNLVFMALEDIMRDVNQDMFGFASSQNIPLTEVFSSREHRDKVAASVRTALRRFEDRSRSNSQELFIKVIISMIALQYGYVEPLRPAYEPDAELPEQPVTLEPSPEDSVDFGAPEDWDIREDAEPVADAAPAEDDAVTPASQEEPAPETVAPVKSTKGKKAK